MAGYSRESERQNKALKAIMRGETPEKRVIVGYDKKEKTKHGDKIDRLSDIMKEARMPWFCPNCDKTMKKRIDDKFWRLFGHCFDCQINFEHKLRLEGKYDEWEQNKIKENKLAWIKDQKQSIIEFKKQQSPEIYNQINPDGHSIEKEKWNIDFKEIIKQADEALAHLDNLEEALK
tara:strand:- start:263 stop:790 length:528 start_codon:yes stop_codon:yes gene_type:complete